MKWWHRREVVYDFKSNKHLYWIRLVYSGIRGRLQGYPTPKESWLRKHRNI